MVTHRASRSRILYVECYFLSIKDINKKAFYIVEYIGKVLNRIRRTFLTKKARKKAQFRENGEQGPQLSSFSPNISCWK